MATEINSYIDELGMDMEEFYRLSEDERVATYENVIRGMSDEELEEFETALRETMSYLYEEYAVQVAELEHIIDSGSSSVEEMARAEVYLEELEAMEEVAHDFSSEFGDAQSELAEHNVETASNYTVDAGSDVDSGEEFVIDCTSAAQTEATADWAEDTNPDWLDTDDDGIGDRNPDEDEDGYADEDFNGDGVITEADMERDGTTDTPQLITITVESTDTVRVSSYDSEAGTVRFAITKEDGTVYYVTVKSVAGALPNIKFTSGAALHAADFETLDPDLVDRIYTEISSVHSLAHYLGMETDDDADYYTLVQMSDQEDNEYALNVSSTDIQNGREVEIYCQDGNTDTIDLDFPADAELTFSEGPDGELVITAEDSSGNEMTVKIYGWQATYTYTGTSMTENAAPDVINVTGGSIDEDALTGLASVADYNDDIPYGYDVWGMLAYLSTMLGGIFTYEGEAMEDWATEEYGSSLSDYVEWQS